MTFVMGCSMVKVLMNHITRLFATLILLLLAPFVVADMYVDRSIVIFEPGDAPRQDIKVSNSGAEDVYVQVEVLEVINAGADDEQRVTVTDPKNIKLLATPNKLIITPDSQKLFRIVNLQPDNDVERVYRINVTPIAAPLDDDASQLRIVVAYQILTIIQPNEPRSDLEVKRHGKSLLLENRGNSNVLLSDGQQCDPTEPTNCVELTSQRLYAGNNWSLELPFDGPVTYSIRSYDGIKTQIFP